MNTDIPESPVDGGGRVRPSRRREQADATRALLLSTAERLYAEHGLSEVSNRQVAEAAGSANNSAVAYHVGTKNDLVAAVSRAHSEAIGRRMQRMVDDARGSTHPRDHVACLVRPYTDHLAGLGTPSWFARFTAQTITDPTLGEDLFFDATLTLLQEQVSDALRGLAPARPADVTDLRARMIRVMVVHTCAEQERTSARTGSPADWDLVGDGLIDAVTAVLLGPVGRSG